MRPEGVATIFEFLLKIASQVGPAAAQLEISYQAADDTVIEGDLVPVIVLALKPAVKCNSTNSSPSPSNTQSTSPP
jgi:hypothetical protein